MEIKTESRSLNGSAFSLSVLSKLAHLDMIFDLDDKFIIKHQVTLWNFVKHSNEEPSKKRDLMVYIHDVCTSKVDLKV